MGVNKKIKKKKMKKVKIIKMHTKKAPDLIPAPEGTESPQELPEQNDKGVPDPLTVVVA